VPSSRFSSDDEEDCMDPLSFLWQNRQYAMIVPVLSLLMLVHEAGHFITARLSGMTVEEFGFGFPPRIFGKEIGGVVYSLNWVPLGAFVRILGEDDPKATGSFASKGVLPRFIVLAAGSAMNFMLAVLLFAGAFAAGWPTPVSMTVAVAGVQSPSPAEAAGLQVGDVIQAVGDRTTATLDEVQRATRASAGQTVPFRIQRGDEELVVPVTLRDKWPANGGPLGVQLSGRDVVMEPISYSPFVALGKGLERSWQLVSLTLSVPVLLFQGAITPDVAKPIGIVGMAKLTGEAASTVGQTGWLFPLLTLTAAFSAGLSVANMLPLPGLDGGRLLFLIIEAVRGRRIAPERAELVHAVGIAILLALMGVLIVSDIVSPAPPIDWGIGR
jgi:regulator of sigma E protease